MVKRTNRIGGAGIIIIVIAIAFFLSSQGILGLNLSAITGGGERIEGTEMTQLMEISQVYSVDRVPVFSPFAIFLDRSSYTQGEIAKVTDFQDINANCGLLKPEIKLINPSGVRIFTATKNILNAGYMTAFYEISVDTTNLDPGVYTIEARWFCDGLELGDDGFRDARMTPTASQSFEVVVLQTNPPPQTCSKSCNVGQQLVSPSSVDCFCRNTWVGGDGVCDLGEPTVAVDCEKKEECQSNQIPIEGLCIRKDLLCPQFGGTKLCDTNGNGNGGGGGLNLLYILSIGAGIILIITGLVVSFRRK